MGKQYAVLARTLVRRARLGAPLLAAQAARQMREQQQWTRALTPSQRLPDTWPSQRVRRERCLLCTQSAAQRVERAAREVASAPEHSAEGCHAFDDDKYSTGSSACVGRTRPNRCFWRREIKPDILTRASVRRPVLAVSLLSKNKNEKRKVEIMVKECVRRVPPVHGCFGIAPRASSPPRRTG